MGTSGGDVRSKMDFLDPYALQLIQVWPISDYIKDGMLDIAATILTADSCVKRRCYPDRTCIFQQVSRIIGKGDFKDRKGLHEILASLYNSYSSLQRVFVCWDGDQTQNTRMDVMTEVRRTLSRQGCVCDLFF